METITITITITKPKEEIIALATALFWTEETVDEQGDPISATDFIKNYIKGKLVQNVKEIKKSVAIKQVNKEINQTPETSIEVA